jgi:glycosyltransferase involved in cell wall biosynthesis
MAGPTVKLLGHVPDEHLPELYAGARAVLVPQIEDAGVVALEAQACGTPVIALKRGGVLDTVREGVTGIFFGEQTISALREALERFKRTTFNADRIRNHARQFSSERFRREIAHAVGKACERYGKTKGWGTEIRV